jgi:putative membrane protein insertion efficiency factor
MSPLVRLLALLVRGYQLVFRPILPPACKFVPSCSDYAIEALRTHGALKGVGLAGWRILRCNPFSAGGYDPVPARHPTGGADHAAFHGVGCSHTDIS